MKIDSSKIKYNNKYNNKITIISTSNISNNYLKFKRVSSSSTRHIVGNSPVYPSTPSSTSSLPDRLSVKLHLKRSIHRLFKHLPSIPLPSPLLPAYSQIDQAELANEKKRSRRCDTPRDALLFSIVNNDACSSAGNKSGLCCRPSEKNQRRSVVVYEDYERSPCFI